MDSKLFLKEAIDSGLAPDDFEEKYAEFCTYQKLVLGVLKEFHRVCEEKGVLYELAYGSLLGAVRDRGQIPWDYDIDVFVPIEEKQKLIDALNTEMSKEYYYYCPESSKRCRHVIMRIAPKGCRSETLHVDVFFVSGTPDRDNERKQYIKQVKKLAGQHYLKLLNTFEEADNPKTLLKILACKMTVLSKSADNIYAEYNTLTSKYPAVHSSICVEADAYADWFEFPGEILWDTVIVETNDGPLRIPQRYDEILKMLYGEYNNIPPIGDRILEVLTHLNKIKRYERFKMQYDD